MSTPNTIIRLPSDARETTQEEIREAKNYILRRTSASDATKDNVDELVREATEQLVRIAYKYNLPASTFAFDGNVSVQMMEEVDEVMEELEQALLENVEEYALLSTDDYRHKSALLAFLLTLGHRGMNMRQTIDAYCWRTLRQTEALIAVYLAGGVPLSRALNRIGNDLHHFQNTPEIRDAVRHPQDFSAPYIRNGGKATFPDGSDNVSGVPVDGVSALQLLEGTAVERTWMEELQRQMQDNPECIGFYVLRGSNYNCDHCDSHVGYHDKEELDELPLYHPHCYCYTVPVYSNGEK